MLPANNFSIKCSDSGTESGSSEGGVCVPIKTTPNPKDYLDVTELLDNQKLIRAIRNKQCRQDNFETAFSQLTFQGADLKSLFEALNTNPEIHTLKLGTMDEGKYSRQFSTICELLSTNTTITNFYLFMFSVYEEGLKNIVDLLKKNTTIVSLNLFSSKIHARKSTLFVCELLLNNKSLRSLNLGQMSLEDTEFMMVFEALAKNTTVNHISFESTYKLREMGPNKKSLMIELLLVFKKHPSLTSIDIHHNQFSVEEITELANVLKENPRITSLNISDIGNDRTVGNKALTPEGYKILADAIENSKTLQHLAMNIMMFDEKTHKQVLDALINNTSIRRLEFNNSINDQSNFINFLKSQRFIESIKLPTIYSWTDEFAKLDDAFDKNKRIKEVIFSSPGKDVAWYERLLIFLRKHPQITSMTVCYDYHMPEMRARFQKRVEYQLEENRKKLARQCFLEGFYITKAYLKSLKEASLTGSKEVSLLPRFRKFDKIILNNILLLSDLAKTTGKAAPPRVLTKVPSEKETEDTLRAIKHKKIVRI